MSQPPPLEQQKSDSAQQQHSWIGEPFVYAMIAARKLPRQLTSLYHVTHYLVLSYFFCIAYPLALRPRAKHDETSLLFGEGLVLPFGLEVDLVVGMALFFLYDLLILFWKRGRRRSSRSSSRRSTITTVCISSFDEGMHRFLLDCKILSLLLTLFAGHTKNNVENDHSFLFGLVALYASMAILLVPPRYDGDSKVILLTKRTFHTEVLLQGRGQQQGQSNQRERVMGHDEQSARDNNDCPHDNNNDSYYLVMFHNKWDAKCHFFEPQFCNLSMTYDDNNADDDHTENRSTRIKFASLDIANCPDLACTLLIVDEQSGEPQQLPALIMFQNGQEVRRLPQVNDMGKAIQCSIHEDVVIRHFDLDAIAASSSVSACGESSTTGIPGPHCQSSKKSN